MNETKDAYELAAAYLFHFLQAEQARREYIHLVGKDPENPYVEPMPKDGTISIAERMKEARERVMRMSPQGFAASR